jgi:hypothetical protein
MDMVKEIVGRDILAPKVAEEKLKRAALDYARATAAAGKSGQSKPIKRRV